MRAGMRQVSKGVLAPWSAAEGDAATAVVDAVAVAPRRSNSSASLTLPLWGGPGWGLSFTIIASFLLGFLRFPWMAPASPCKDASGLSAQAYSLSLSARAGMRQVSKGVLVPWSAAEGASGRKADTAFSGMASRARPGPSAHHALIQPYPVIHVTAVPGRDPLSTPG